jgi:hypothetical protein
MISRRIFLKMLGAGALILGISGPYRLAELLNKRILAQNQVQHPSIPESKNLLSRSFTYNIYQDISGAYVAQKSDGSIAIQSVHNSQGQHWADTVIKFVLNSSGPQNDPINGPKAGPGHIHIQDGNYYLSPTFDGFDLYSYTRLDLDPQACIIVPNGYGSPILNGTNYVFRLKNSAGTFDSTTSNCLVDGGIIKEAGHAPQRFWTAIELQASTDGVFLNKFMNTSIYDANIGIKFFINGPKGWINANSFQFLKMIRNRLFIEFNMDSNIPYKGESINGIHRNHFENIDCQAAISANDGFDTLQGVKDIKHNGNTFIDVKIWDLRIGTVNSNIAQEAEGTIILAGVMTQPRFEDKGKGTKILDQWMTKL